MRPDAKPGIAFWFRYGPAEHTELFHALPEIIEGLAKTCDVHYFGLDSGKPVPPRIAQSAVVHLLPLRVDRTRQRDKFLKTALWVLCLPWVGRKCRRLGIRAVYIDETIPLTAFLARLFFGKQVAITVADIFVDIYSERHPLARPLARVIRAADMASWRKLPLVFTRARSTSDYLVRQGFAPGRVKPVYDPCDFAIYHPADRGARARFGFKDSDVVLAHHGILHPNKGNDRILRALALARDRLPDVRYLLVGDGPDMPRLRRLAGELGIEDRVVFTGWLQTLPEVNAALNAGDIGLVMRIGQESDHFHLTGALVHSMACGLPILAARLGGVSEVVAEGRNGLLFDPNNIDEFTQKLSTLAGDAELRRRLGRAAHADALDLFDIRRVAEQTVEPLLELVKAA